MPDAVFAQPRLARLYDTFDGERDDLSAYLRMVDELGARRVLDLGCGTGSFAVLAARSGRVVVAVDPAQASLDVARGKAGADRVRWVCGDAASLRSPAGGPRVGEVGRKRAGATGRRRRRGSREAPDRPGREYVFVCRRT